MEKENKQSKMYFLAIVLPAAIDEKVVALKNWMKENYGAKVGLKSSAHITMVPPFWMMEEQEQPLIQDIQTLALQTPDFSLVTANFSAFKPRTIFVAVAPSEQLTAFKKTVDHFFHQTDYPVKLETRPFHPHITIATRDLHKKDFSDAWPHFQHRKFIESFNAAGLSLLKHNGHKWDVIFTAPFATPSPMGAVTHR